MQPIAAYYVMIANDVARSRAQRYQVVVSKPSLPARISTALTEFRRPPRPVGGSPA